MGGIGRTSFSKLKSQVDILHRRASTDRIVGHIFACAFNLVAMFPFLVIFQNCETQCFWAIVIMTILSVLTPFEAKFALKVFARIDSCCDIYTEYWKKVKAVLTKDVEQLSPEDATRIINILDEGKTLAARSGKQSYFSLKEE